MRRGARTAQPLSRKWRLSSPTIVWVAYVENSTARSGSKRSTALSRPTDATCTRSSVGSPRFEKRRARYSARPRWASTSSSRRRASLDCANSANFCLSAARSAGSKGTSGSGVPLQQPKARATVVVGQLVLVHQCVEDALGQVGQCRHLHPTVEGPLALHLQGAGEDLVAKEDGALAALGADQG